MLLAFLIYNDGIGTIYRMAGIYGTELKIDRTVIIASIMIVQFVGIPCAFLLAGHWRVGSAPSDRFCSGWSLTWGFASLAIS